MAWTCRQPSRMRPTCPIWFKQWNRPVFPPAKLKMSATVTQNSFFSAIGVNRKRFTPGGNHFFAFVYQPSTKKAASRLRRRGRRLFQFLGRLPDVYRFHFFTSEAAVFQLFHRFLQPCAPCKKRDTGVVGEKVEKPRIFWAKRRIFRQNGGTYGVYQNAGAGRVPARKRPLSGRKKL